MVWCCKTNHPTDAMASPTTEHADPRYHGIDTWASSAVVRAIVEAQRGAIDAVGEVAEEIAVAADALSALMRGGGRLAYAGAGSSGLLAQVDALELPGTYGIALDAVPVLLAGGPEALRDIPSGAEDDAEAGAAGVDALGLGPEDGLVALSASGRTPYALGALRQAKRRGALTVGIACNPHTPLLEEAAHPICLETPAEVIAGSTRMAAGTAQKCALNALSTLLGIRLGHAYEGLMVNMQPDNAKLKQRAVGIVAEAAGVDRQTAAEALGRALDIKGAVMLCAGASDVEAARRRLTASGGDLRVALASLTGG